jgi:hypothetical protein
MALVLTKETGALVANANSYASAADGDAYHEGHIYPSAWTGASLGTKEAALVMATRLIDGCYQFNGYKVSASQSLQWPREGCLDPDAPQTLFPSILNQSSQYFPSNAVPNAVVNATCELARELIKADTTDPVDKEGLSELTITGAISLRFDKRDRQPTITGTARVFLSKLGTYLSGTSNSVRLVRV